MANFTEEYKLGVCHFLFRHNKELTYCHELLWMAFMLTLKGVLKGSSEMTIHSGLDVGII